MTASMTPTEAADRVERRPMAERGFEDVAIRVLLDHARAATTPSDDLAAARHIVWSHLAAVYAVTPPDPDGTRAFYSSDVRTPVSAAQLAERIAADLAPRVESATDPEWGERVVSELAAPAHGAIGTEITHAEARKLPLGSWVLELNQSGAPAFGTATTPIMTTAYTLRRPTKAPADRLLVVARGFTPEPVRTLAVGDPVRTAEELNGLPVGAVVAFADGDVGKQYASGWTWMSRGPINGYSFPARVLDLPVDQAPATDGGAS